MRNKFFSIKSQNGVTMIEYALIAALVAIVAITTLTLIGTNLNTLFNTIASKLVAP
ncbi:MAG: Flp family type IVb pilin [Chlorobium sp.]|jgi:pilus assembly protein Flp/PilA|nr:Flp family type IVb pilin [Chlorobium sp.]